MSADAILWKMAHVNGSYQQGGEVHSRFIYYNKSCRRIKRAVFMRDDIQHQGHGIQSKQRACDTRQDNADDDVLHKTCSHKVQNT